MEHVHDDRQGRWQHDRRAESLDCSGHDQERVSGCQRTRERCGSEDRQADHQDAAAPEQVGRATAEEQETAEGQTVGGHDPLEVGFAEMQAAADRGQCHIDNREIDDGHEERHGQDGESPPAMRWDVLDRSHADSSRFNVESGRPCDGASLENSPVSSPPDRK